MQQLLSIHICNACYSWLLQLVAVLKCVFSFALFNRNTSYLVVSSYALYK